MKLVCQNCSKEFKTYNRQAKYCSKECYYKGRWGAEGRLISKVCPVCQKRFSSHLSNNQKYCSTDCSDKSGHTRGRRNTITKSCDWCGKEFSRPASNFHSKHFFCSPECSLCCDMPLIRLYYPKRWLPHQNIRYAAFL